MKKIVEIKLLNFTILKLYQYRWQKKNDWRTSTKETEQILSEKGPHLLRCAYEKSVLQNLKGQEVFKLLTVVSFGNNFYLPLSLTVFLKYSAKKRRILSKFWDRLVVLGPKFLSQISEKQDWNSKIGKALDKTWDVK